MSREFFLQLQTFSERYFDSLKIEEKVTPWGPDDYAPGGPKGVVMHYTADEDFDRVVKFFMRERYQAKAAANVVIADRKYPRCEPMLEGLDLLEKLPVTIIQCSPPNDPTWHATWASDDTYGIELLNVGELRRDDAGKLCSHWRRDHDPDEKPWTMPWANPTKSAVQAWGRWWEPYTGDQVEGLVILLRELLTIFPDLDPSWVVGHECVQSVHTIGAKGRDKRDPGPALPIHQIRAAMFGDAWNIREPTSAAGWACDQIVREYAAALVPMERDETGTFVPSELPSPGVAWARFHSSVQQLVNGKPFGIVGKTALKLLGYHVPTHISADMHDTDRIALWIFQKSQGLKPDQVPGPKTRKVILDRLYDRGILRP